MTSKPTWLRYLKNPFVLSMTMHLGILLLLIIFSQQFVPELPPVPDTLEASLVSRSALAKLSNIESENTPPASSAPASNPTPTPEKDPIITSTAKTQPKYEKPNKNKLIEDKPKVEPIKKSEEKITKETKELKKQSPEKMKEIPKKVEEPKKTEKLVKKEAIKTEKTPPKKEQDTPPSPKKPESEKKASLKIDKEAKDKADKEAKNKADKLAQAKIDKEAKDKADKLAQAKANIANLNKNAIDNEITAQKNSEKKEAQAKLLKAAQATSHDAEDGLLAEQQLADKKAAEKLALENSNKDLASLMDKYTRQIQKAIKQQWNKPPNTEKLSATVRITVFPDGEVRNIYISKSSGNDAFDASIKAAIDKASPLPVPKDNQALNEKFRLLTFNFGSED